MINTPSSEVLKMVSPNFFSCRMATSLSLFTRKMAYENMMVMASEMTRLLLYKVSYNLSLITCMLGFTYGRYFKHITDEPTVMAYTMSSSQKFLLKLTTKVNTRKYGKYSR